MERGVPHGEGRLSPSEALARMRELAPLAVWARRLDVHQTTLTRLSMGHYEYARHVLNRIIALVIAHDRGEWRFIPSSRRDSKNWRWEGLAQFERPQMRLEHGVNGFNLRINQ